MPTYSVEVRTQRGPERFSFTIDDARSLMPQIHHILEELQQRGVTLRGAPGDELVVSWDGKRLNGKRTPDQLGISPDRSIELTMDRKIRADPKPEPKRAGEPVRQFIPVGTHGLVVLAGLAGLAAWFISGILGRIVWQGSGIPFSDVAAAAVLGSFLGGTTWGWLARLQRERSGRAVLMGLLVGGVTGFVVGLICALVLTGDQGSALPLRAELSRVMCWGVLGVCLGTVLAFGAARLERFPPATRIPVTALSGLVFGIVSGAILLLPGPSPFWYAGAFVILGLGIGNGLAVSRLRPSLGIVELEQLAGKTVGRWASAEWPIVPGRQTILGDFADGRTGERVLTIEVASSGGRIKPVTRDSASQNLRVNGNPIRGSLSLLNGDRIEIGRSTYRYRIRQRRWR